MNVRYEVRIKINGKDFVRLPNVLPANFPALPKPGEIRLYHLTEPDTSPFPCMVTIELEAHADG